MKKILLGAAAIALFTKTVYAQNGFYLGLGLGRSFANMSNKTTSVAYDTIDEANEAYGFGDRKLKDDAFVGKLFGGYEYEMRDVSLLFEVGYIADTSEAKYGDEKNTNQHLGLEYTFDEATGLPTITSMKLKRKRTVSVGVGVKKEVANAVSMMAGLDLLHTQFQFQSKEIATYTPAVNGVVKRKSKYGLAPWVGISWDAGIIEVGLRYQYAQYQKLQTGGDFSPGNFSISNKIKPEYQTVMFTMSKKF